MLWYWMNRNITYSFNNNWLNIVTSNWNEMSSVDFDHWCGRSLNWCHFVVENSSIDLGYNNERNISNLSNLESVYFFVSNNRSSDIMRVAGRMNWNVSDSS